MIVEVSGLTMGDIEQLSQWLSQSLWRQYELVCDGWLRRVVIAESVGGELVPIATA
jgi:hypothetical protein